MGKTDCENPQGRKDTCKGDGGGPLMCASSSDASVFIQAGITAWGINCGTDGIPGAYASVTKAVCFIKWTTQCFYGKRWEGILQFNKRPKKNPNIIFEQIKGTATRTTLATAATSLTPRLPR